MITKIALVFRPGQCRWCGCTEYRPCLRGCGWVDRQQTLCSACQPLDQAMRTARGRQLLAQFTQHADVDGAGLSEFVPRGTSSQTSQKGSQT